MYLGVHKVDFFFQNMPNFEGRDIICLVCRYALFTSTRNVFCSKMQKVEFQFLKVIPIKKLLPMIHLCDYNYRTCAIITHGLYIFYPILKGQKCFFKELFFVNFYPYVRLLFKSGLLSSAGYDGQCTVHSIIFGAFNSTTASMLTVGHPVAILLNLICI